MTEQGIIDSRLIINLLGILERIPELQTAWEQSAGIGTGIDRIEQITREQNQLETKKQRLTVAIAEGVLDFADAKQQMTAIKNAQEALKHEKHTLISAISEPPPWEALAAVHDIFRTIAAEEQREVINAAIKQIKVYNAYMLITYRFPVTTTGDSTTRIHLPSTNHKGIK
jgi:hypothetical protein